MKQWGIFASSTPNPDGSEWMLYPKVAEPHKVFAWAAPGTSYAAQVVQGRDGRFYLYALVTQANSKKEDPFAIGVAVSDSPTGPYVDAHPSGPIISQPVPLPGNSIQNIDPTVLVDDDGKVYIYFGTFGALRAYELDADMVTVRLSVTQVNGLTGYFEARWLMKCKGVYYLLFTANNVGPDSPCMPTLYHACIAYAEASSPLGPWKFWEVILPIVSSTTSHPGAIELNGEWFLVYLMVGAKGGDHFRRSIALDKLNWDDSQSPPVIRKIVQTIGAKPPAPTYNIAPKAVASSKYPSGIQDWIKAVNDGIIRANPLPPDYWSSYEAEKSRETSVLTYVWKESVELNGTSMVFFADQDAGANVGVAPPKKWFVEYLDQSSNWKPVVTTTPYPLKLTDTPQVVKFEPIRTTSIRATLVASGSGGQFAGVGVKEWEALATELQKT